jgi:hypothetical protein
MRRRPDQRFRPDLERFEPKQLLSDGPSPAHVRAASLPDARAAPAVHPAETSGAHSDVIRASGTHAARFTLSRITNTSAGNAVHLVPPFQQVLVQAKPPVPGRT